MENYNRHVSNTAIYFQKIAESIGLLAAVFGFFLLSNALGATFANLLPDIQIEAGKTILDMHYSDEVLKKYIFINQLIGTVLGMIMLPILYLILMNRPVLNTLIQPKEIKASHYLTAVFVVFSILPFIGKVGDWNKNVQLPDLFAGVQQSMQVMEDQAAGITKIITQYSNGREFLIVLLLIAVLPAVAEELVFRGILQTGMFRITKSVWLSIFISSFVFSFIHLQFFGFFPRMLLGVILGVLYHYSGNLTVSMLMHFINNAFAVMMMQMYRDGDIQIDPEGDMDMTWTSAIASLVFTGIIIYLNFRSSSKEKTPYV